jgi:hypothetical protein
MTGGNLLSAFDGLLKFWRINMAGLPASRENSWFFDIGSSPAPSSSDVIFPSLKGLR